jgi:hypothetical protein
MTASPILKPTLAIHLPSYSPGGRILLSRCIQSPPTLALPVSKNSCSISAPNTPVNQDNKKNSFLSTKIPASSSFTDSHPSTLKFVKHYRHRSDDSFLNGTFPVSHQKSYHKNLLEEFESTDDDFQPLRQRRYSISDENTTVPKQLKINEVETQLIPSNSTTTTTTIILSKSDSFTSSSSPTFFPKSFLYLLTFFAIFWYISKALVADAQMHIQQSLSFHCFMFLSSIMIAVIPIISYMSFTWIISHVAYVKHNAS